MSAEQELTARSWRHNILQKNGESSKSASEYSLPPSKKAQSKIEANTMTAGRDLTVVVHQRSRDSLNTEASSRSELQDYSYTVPPPPNYMVDRDEELNQLVSIFLFAPNARVAILGTGGIGKTTLATAVMNEAVIVNKYPKRYFLSFEGLFTIDLVYSALAGALGILISQRRNNQQLLAGIMQRLRESPTLLCFDNFESFWEPPDRRRAAENLLTQLSSLPLLGLLVTMRGVQRPKGVQWTPPVLKPLVPIGLLSSLHLVKQIAGEDIVLDDMSPLNSLLEAVSGVPLAVTLIGHLLQDAVETPQTLWGRWCREHTRVINNGGSDRLSSWDISIQLSLNSPRMINDGDAIKLLAALAILPDGLPMDDQWQNELQEVLSPDIQLSQSIQTLRNVALCSLDRFNYLPRLRLLPPIRYYCLDNLSLNNPISATLLDFYIQNIAQRSNLDSESNYTWVTVELPNITGVLRHALSHQHLSENLGEAAINYTRWLDYLGTPNADILTLTIASLTEYPLVRGTCFRCLADEYRRDGHLEDALQVLGEALKLHRQARDRRNEAFDLESLGRVHVELGQYEEAKDLLNEALQLHRSYGRHGSEADTLQHLAFIHNMNGDLMDAHSCASEALRLHRSMSATNGLGEVNALNTLAEIFNQQRKVEKAIEMASEAAVISQKIKYVYGQATATANIGLIWASINEFAFAVEHLQLGIDLFNRVHAIAEAQRIQQDLTAILTKISLISSRAELVGMDRGSSCGCCTIM